LQCFEREKLKRRRSTGIDEREENGKRDKPGIGKEKSRNCGLRERDNNDAGAQKMGVDYSLCNPKNMDITE